MRPIHHGRPEGRHIPPLDERGKERGSGRRGEHHRRGGGHGTGGGAQTYRRGRILTFLEQLHNKRATLARQLGEAEFQSIQPVISGELKAIEQVISDYMYLFELREEDRIKTEPGESSPEAIKED